MRSLTFALLILGAGCSHNFQPARDDRSGYGLMDNNFVTDLTLRNSPSPTDLRDLLLTLPVFEVDPESRRAFVYRVGILSSHNLHVPGDGAQSSLTLKRLSKPNHYELVIEDLEESTSWIYQMERSDRIGYGYDGWHILSRIQKNKA